MLPDNVSSETNFRIKLLLMFQFTPSGIFIGLSVFQQFQTITTTFHIITVSVCCYL